MPGSPVATSELASNGDGGMQVELSLVPLRDASLQPQEILMSESQERMMAVVEPKHLDEFMAITEKWDVEATVIGEVTDGDHLVITWHGEVIVDVPPRSVAHEGPTYNRPLARPAYLDGLNAAGTAEAGQAADGRGDPGAAADAARLAQPLRQVVDHRPVRPLRARQHRSRAAR